MSYQKPIVKKVVADVAVRNMAGQPIPVLATVATA